jgi:hypothetical protein
MPFIPFGALTNFTTTWGWRRTIACRVCRTWVVRACGVLSRPLGLTLTTTLSLNERQITKQLRGALGNHPALLGRHVPLARQMLRTLLDGNIPCEPIEEGPQARLPLHGNRDIWANIDRNQCTAPGQAN